jgi:hypothetical protein
MALRRAGRVALALAALALPGCGSGDAAVSACDPTLPQLSTWNDPVYPGATHVRRPGLAGDDPTLRFDTSAPPAVVLAYYRDTLERDGWRADPLQTPAPGDLGYLIANCCYYGGVSVHVEAAGSGSQVAVRHWWDPGCD